MAQLTETRTQQQKSGKDVARVTVPDYLHQLVLENTIVGVSYMINRHFVWANARMAEIG